jgi:predicted nucleic acid-binding protein
MRIYLDNCCYNRPYDNWDNLIVKLEAEAKLHVQKMIKDGELELVWSYIMDIENDQNPYSERRERIAVWQNLAAIDVDESPIIIDKSKELIKLGLHESDSLHIACAIFAKADCFLTTDKKILNKPLEGISVASPIDFLRRYYNG